MAASDWADVGVGAAVGALVQQVVSWITRARAAMKAQDADTIEARFQKIEEHLGVHR